MTKDAAVSAVLKYTGPTREHPLMIEALDACGNRAFAVALCDFIDARGRVSGVDVVDALRIVAGTLCDMQWMLKD